MASLSTCHLGLWLGWQILLNVLRPAKIAERKKADWFVRLRGLFTIAKATSFAAKFACTRKQEHVCHREGLRQAQEDLAKHDICADHRRSMLLPKRQRQIDFVTAKDHANSAIISHRLTVLTQAMHRLPTAKKTFMRKPSRSVR